MCYNSKVKISNINSKLDTGHLTRVRTGPVPGSGPSRSNTGPNRSRIFFWTVAGPFAAFLTSYVQQKV